MPKQTTERVIALWAGDSGSGKSFAVANLKNALIFDTDLGGGLAYLDARIKRNGSERIEVGSYVDVIDQINHRRGKLKNVTTLAIDHLTTLQQEAVGRHNPTMAEGTFGKEHDKAAKEWRRIRDLVRWGDFHMVCTAHLKAKYVNKEPVGLLTDASKNIDADFTMVLHLVRGSGYPSLARVVKWRRDPEDERGAIPSTFPFTLEKFVELHGCPLEGPRQEVTMASQPQIDEVERLLKIVKLPDGMVEKWFAKAKAEEWTDFTAEALDKCIDHLAKLLKGAA